MPTESPGAIAQFLVAWSDGEEGALERLAELLRELEGDPRC